MFSAIKSLITVMALALLISGCGPGEQEIKSLGFSSAAEMKEIQSKGFKTMNEYAKSLGFASVVEMNDLQSKGFKTKDDVVKQSLAKVQSACALGNGQSNKIFEGGQKGIHAFCWGFNSALGDVVNKTNEFDQDLVKLPFKLSACDATDEVDAQSDMKLGQAKVGFCILQKGESQRNCFDNLMRACSPIMQETLQAIQILSEGSQAYGR